MKIRTRFIIFGVYTFVVIILLIYLQIRMVRSVTEYSRIYQHTIKSSAIARQYQQNSAFLTQFVRSYVATGDAKYEQAYNDCIAISGGTKPTPINYDRGIYWSIYLGSGKKPSYDGETKSYSNVMKDLNFSKEMFDYLTLSKSRSEELVKLEVQAMEIIKNIPRNPDGSIPDEYKGRQLEAIELVNGKSYEESVAQIMTPINQFFDKLDSDNNLNLQNAAGEVKKDTILFFICLFIVGFSVVIFLASLGRKIGKNLRLCVSLASEISHGNLTVKIDPSKYRGHSEFDSLLSSFDEMVSHLREIITRVLESSREISEAATEIAQGNTDLSSRTETQASHLEETASSMEQIASTIKSSADNSLRGNQMMQDSEKSVQEAGEIIEATTNNIELVFEASNKITDITKIIENIAFQTNILALNAAVEAARAGEQGKGFAVVASEVRNLAQTSQSSVKDITSLIADSNDKIRIATETARKSKEIFMDIEQKIEDTSKIMQDISAMAVEQQAGVDQVNMAVSQMDQSTQQNATLVEQATASSEALMGQAKELVDLMHFFKV
ncbi:methyl-accepting chemotaxis protein [Brachyspira innocens]|uniref:Methyl-accepting chemotaxis protein n=1 Tax=Brachyspira innocens TaxID=13264 RepID=A0ABT8YXW2_9SPIR|nr:methyl-accepting chemotaxis protein [Brachyspira innocens]MDO6994683.1 methyl-accepting chemotaxis protein [Brachyspira innocens]MDO7020711.1 methyl-accepting chemotaxis protein [Brachyspira innocens]